MPEANPNPFYRKPPKKSWKDVVSGSARTVVKPEDRVDIAGEPISEDELKRLMQTTEEANVEMLGKQQKEAGAPKGNIVAEEAGPEGKIIDIGEAYGKAVEDMSAELKELEGWKEKLTTINLKQEGGTKELTTIYKEVMGMLNEIKNKDIDLDIKQFETDQVNKIINLMHEKLKTEGGNEMLEKFKKNYKIWEQKQEKIEDSKKMAA